MFKTQRPYHAVLSYNVFNVLCSPDFTVLEHLEKMYAQCFEPLGPVSYFGALLKDIYFPCFSFQLNEI